MNSEAAKADTELLAKRDTWPKVAEMRMMAMGELSLDDVRHLHGCHKMSGSGKSATLMPRRRGYESRVVR